MKISNRSSSLSSTSSNLSSGASSNQVSENDYFNADGIHNGENTDELVHKAKLLLKSENITSNDKNEYTVELVRGNKGLGLGLIDAMVSKKFILKNSFLKFLSNKNLSQID